MALLDPRVAPRVYERDGFTITFWTYYEPQTARELTPADYAAALSRLHVGMQDIDVATPHFTDRVTEAQLLVGSPDRTPELGAADRDLLVRTFSRVMSVIPDEVRRAAAPRRATPRERPEHEERPLVHRPRDGVSRSDRVRPRPRSEAGQRLLRRDRSCAARGLPRPRARDDRGLASDLKTGSRRKTGNRRAPRRPAGGSALPGPRHDHRPPVRPGRAAHALERQDREGDPGNLARVIGARWPTERPSDPSEVIGEARGLHPASQSRRDVAHQTKNVWFLRAAGREMAHPGNERLVLRRVRHVAAHVRFRGPRLEGMRQGVAQRGNEGSLVRQTCHVVARRGTCASSSVTCATWRR